MKWYLKLIRCRLMYLDCEHVSLVVRERKNEATKEGGAISTRVVRFWPGSKKRCRAREDQEWPEISLKYFVPTGNCTAFVMHKKISLELGAEIDKLVAVLVLQKVGWNIAERGRISNGVRTVKIK